MKPGGIGSGGGAAVSETINCWDKLWTVRKSYIQASISNKLIFIGATVILAVALFVAAFVPAVTCPKCTSDWTHPTNDGTPGLDACNVCDYGKITLVKKFRMCLGASGVKKRAQDAGGGR